MSSSDESGVTLARTKFEPLRRFLDHLSRVIVRKYDQHACLEEQGFQETARNTYDVRYSLGRAGNDRLSFNFILTGDNADLVLLQDNEPVAGETRRQVDQRVYRLDQIDDLKRAVQDKVISHLKNAA